MASHEADLLMWGRIVVAGTLLQHAIVPDSAAPFDFQAAYGLSSQLVGVLPLRASALLGLPAICCLQ